MTTKKLIDKLGSMLSMIFITLLALSIIQIISQMSEYRTERESVERALEIVRGKEEMPGESQGGHSLPNNSGSTHNPDEYPSVGNAETVDFDVEYLLTMDMDKLQSINPDVVGWIMIPDTEISYPLLQSKDNDYYLKHAWDNQENSCGSIFYDYRSSPSDWNAVIYGHNMKNGSMFANLHNYSDVNFQKDNNRLLILLDGEVKEYAFTVAFEAELDDIPYRFGKLKEGEKDDFVNKVYEESGKRVSKNASFISLSTCTGLGHHTRWVVIFSTDIQEPVLKQDF